MRDGTRRRLPTMVMLLGVLGPLVPAAPAAAESETHTVYMSNIAFCHTPQCVPFENEDTTIAVGDTVRWVFADGMCTAGLIIDGCHHNVTHRPQDGGTREFGSGPMPFTFPYGDLTSPTPLMPDFEHTFDDPGTYRYVCTIHEGQMVADVIVVG